MDRVEKQGGLSPEVIDAVAPAGGDGDWTTFRDDEILQQQDAIRAVETSKMPFVGDKEHIFKFQDTIEVARIKESVEQCKKALQDLGYAEFTFEDFFVIFHEQLDDAVQSTENAMSDEELLRRARDQSVSDYVVMFFRFITTGEIRRRAEFFEPFILGLSDKTVDQFCKTSVEPMGEESDHIHITALSDALGVPIRVEYLDRSSSDDGVALNHHDFVPSTGGNTDNLPKETKFGLKRPFVRLLYRPGHYDILYSKD